MINPLIAVRDIHFLSSIILAGIVFFDCLIASPSLRRHFRTQVAGRSFHDTSSRLFWICLALSILSALAWLCLLSARITGRTIGVVIADGTVWKVLSATQFGVAWEVRLFLGILLAAIALPWRKPMANSGWRKLLTGLLAGAYLGTLAFAGHGGEGLGFDRNIHLAADFLHLIAAGLWLGGLMPLVLLLAFLRLFREEDWLPAAAEAANRFSTLGIFAVGILLVSGTINASFLLSGIHRLIDTAYGRWLLFKITLAAAMVVLAAVNRQHLLPQLYGDVATAHAAMTTRSLIRNTLIEIALGTGIVLVVGMLGIMAPANEMAGHLH